MSGVSAVQHVFVVGSKGIPGSYGGYETFVDRLTEYHEGEPGLRYHVACKSLSESGEFSYHNARCFRVRVPQIGPAQAIWYDVAALADCVAYIRRNRIPHPIVYVLACRIGPFTAHFARAVHRLGGKLYVNPDGHEWMRAKWSAPVRRYWKVSERMMTKHADLMVCDSVNMEKYIREEYARYRPQTTFIAYGAEGRRSRLADDDPKLLDWFRSKGLEPKSYYLVVGRFVPENNYETMIREFMASNSKRDFALVTNVSDKFLEELKEKTHFDRDPRIKFVGTVYDRELLMKIREDAYAYFHGHEVGVHGSEPAAGRGLQPRGRSGRRPVLVQGARRPGPPDRPGRRHGSGRDPRVGRQGQTTHRRRVQLAAHRRPIQKPLPRQRAEGRVKR